MGQCGVLRSSSVTSYLFPSRKKGDPVTYFDATVNEPDQTCDCGQAYIPQHARFCVACGKRREGFAGFTSIAPDGTGQGPQGQLTPEKPEKSPPRSPRNSKFAPILSSSTSSGPSVFGRRTTNRSLTDASNTTSGSASDSSIPSTGDGNDPVAEEVVHKEEDVIQFHVPRSSSLNSAGTGGGTPARRPSSGSLLDDAEQRRLALNGSQHGSQHGSRHSTGEGKAMNAIRTSSFLEDVASTLTQALKHSGSIVTQNLRMRALQVPENLAGTYNAVPKPDMLMPQFDAKVDQDNLMEKLPQLEFLRAIISLQRVTFMSTDWLGIRLAHNDEAKCTRFCLCATALQNIGKNTSRSVVIQAADEDESLVFACSPMYESSTRRYEGKSSFLNHTDKIEELAQIILNEVGSAEKKVTADLKAWCTKTQRKAEEEARAKESGSQDGPGKVTFEDAGGSPKDKRRFSLSGFVKSLEAAFADLGSDGRSRRVSESSKGTAIAALKERRKSTPASMSTPAIQKRQDSPDKGRRNSGDGHWPASAPAKLVRRHSLGGPTSGPTSPRKDASRSKSDRTDTKSKQRRHRANTLPAPQHPAQDAGSDNSSKEDAQKIPLKKRRPSLSLMPTLDEAKEIRFEGVTEDSPEAEDKALAPIRRRHSFHNIADTKSGAPLSPLSASLRSDRPQPGFPSEASDRNLSEGFPSEATYSTHSYSTHSNRGESDDSENGSCSDIY